MNYEVVLSLEAVEDVLRITMDSLSKTSVVYALKQVKDAMRVAPNSAGEHLSEGLYFVDREPLRAYYTINVDEMIVEIINVKQV